MSELRIDTREVGRGGRLPGLGHERINIGGDVLRFGRIHMSVR